MNYGRFFTLDMNASQLPDGIAVFNYRGLKQKNASRINHNYLREKYPIYVSFSEEGVSFHIHYYEEGKEKLNGRSREVTKQHSNSLILFLPAHAQNDIKDNLTRNINEIFFNRFPDNEKEKIIYNIAVESIKNSEDSDKGITYSSLEIFGINYNKPTNEERPPIVGFLRKLFLDFLYDIEHTSVFHNAQNFEQINIALNENFLFKAIRNKAEYYYQRKLANQVQRSLNTRDKELFLADFFVNAETNWIETITDARAEHCFHNSMWFKSTEEEIDTVYLSKRVGYNNKVISKSKSDRCYDFVKKTKWRRLNKNERDDSPKQISENRRYFKRQRGVLEDQIITNAQEASKWYLHKYNFSGTIKIWFGSEFILRSILLLFLLLSLVATIIVPNLVGSDEILSPLIILGLLISCWILHLRKKIGRVGGINIFMPRLFASIVAAWFTLAIGEDVFKGFFDNEHNLWVSGGLLLVTLVFVIYEIDKLNPYLGWWTILKRSTSLIIIAFIYSFMSGLLVVDFFGSKYLERSDYVNEFYTNNIYTHNPKFKIKDVPRYNHEQFYRILNQYDSTIVRKVSEIELKPYLDIDSITERYLVMPIKEGRDSIKYGTTLFLIHEFAENDTTHLEDIYNHIIEGTTVNRRIEHLVNHIITQDTIRLSKTVLKGLNVEVTRSDIIDRSWISLVKAINNHVVYRESLEHLIPIEQDEDRRILVESKILQIKIFRDLLLQFAFFAMFIGIFLQLIFEEKPVTEPI